MKLKLFLIAASAMALASCSSDEVVKNNEDANAIKFSVVANNAGRAASYWCNLNKPQEFQVWAKFDGKSYFANDWFTNGGSGDTYTEKDDILRYWPQVSNDKAIHFYAAKLNADRGNKFADFTWTDGSGNVLAKPTISYDMTNYTSSTNQHDLLYAYAQETTKPAYGGTTALNFRHALSQIVFMAKNTNKKIHVQITEVKVGNAYKSGVFSYPTDPTKDNFADHAQGGVNNQTGKGTWTNGGDYATFTTGEAFTAEIPYNASNVVNLTNNKAGATPSTKESELANSFLLIPTATATTKWVPGAGAEKIEDTEGSYFAFKATIWNVNNNTAVDKTKDAVVYGGNDAYIYIPYSFDWKPGKKYIYTINFTETGHGGYDKDGNPVLVPIQFTCTVDDFDDATNQAVEIDAEGNKLAPANP